MLVYELMIAHCHQQSSKLFKYHLGICFSLIQIDNRLKNKINDHQFIQYHERIMLTGVKQIITYQNISTVLNNTIPKKTYKKSKCIEYDYKS